jgi:uncharacterized protein (DUF433 family)
MAWGLKIDETAQEYGRSHEDVQAAIGYEARIITRRSYLIQADWLRGKTFFSLQRPRF